MDTDHHHNKFLERMVAVGERLSRQVVTLEIASPNLVSHPF